MGSKKASGSILGRFCEGFGALSEGFGTVLGGFGPILGWILDELGGEIWRSDDDFEKKLGQSL